MIRRPFGSMGLWCAAFAVVAVLVVGGLAWVTVASLHVEAAQREASARADRTNKERFALWRLDAHLHTAFGLENNRPYGHYTALHAQFPAVDPEQQTIYAQSAFRFPSPLLSADLPPWMLLHFQIDPDRGWESPQVIDPNLADRLRGEPSNLTLPNVGSQRDLLLAELRTRFPLDEVLAQLASNDNPDELFIVPVPYAEEPTLPKPPPIDADSPSESRPLYAMPFTRLQSHPALERRASPIPPAGFARGGPVPPGGGGFGGGGFGPGGPPGMPAGPVALAQEKGVGKPNADNAGQGGGRGGARSVKGAETNPDYQKRVENTQQQLNVGRGSLEPPAPTKSTAPSDNNNNKQDPAAPQTPTPASQTGGKDKIAADSKQDEMKKTTPPGAPGGPAPQSAGAMPAFGGSGPTGLGGPVLRASENLNDAAKMKEETDRARDTESRHQAVPGSVRGEKKSAPTIQPVAVHLGTMRPFWLTAADGNELLVLLRAARMENKTVYQGVVLDWEAIRRALAEQIADLFPTATLTPIRATDELRPEHAMTTLPAQLDPGPAPELPPAGWTPLRFGLSLAWVAALLALTAVGFGGRALVSLSERRIRFVSAVTHELRTPLTSLRLYLDLLTSGMVEDADKQKEYLNTLATESERLNRLIENVLDFAKLEKRSVQAVMVPTPVADLLEQLRQTWADRVAQDGKELVVHSTLPPDQMVTTDLRMAAQILGNLIDNSRKYSRDAADPRIWLRAKPSRGRVVFEVEDRGPGVASQERGSVFRAFRRGETADTTCGGAGLGLALAAQWADLLGGTLSYHAAEGGVGACFRLELPGR